MPAKVVDASALAALLFGEAKGAAIAERLRDAGLIAPALWPFEIANACIKKMSPARSARCSAGGLRHARSDGGGLSSELVTLDRRLVAAADATDRLL